MVVQNFNSLVTKGRCGCACEQDVGDQPVGDVCSYNGAFHPRAHAIAVGSFVSIVSFHRFVTSRFSCLIAFVNPEAWPLRPASVGVASSAAKPSSRESTPFILCARIMRRRWDEGLAEK